MWPLQMNAWNRLPQISTLRFEAYSSNNTGWNGTGTGSVQIKQIDAETLAFTESGTWKSESGQQFKFNNVFRWTLIDSGNSIRLEHLRFGAENPVYLFDLATADGQTWHSIDPHVCRDDLYTAILDVTPDHLELRWTVTGPKKNEDIHYWYT